MVDSALTGRDFWQQLKRVTDARIGLGRSGVSSPTSAHLAFQFDHAQARDAVLLPLDFDVLQAEFNASGFDVVRLRSQAEDRHTYLQRPDLGRRLHLESVAALEQVRAGTAAHWNAVIVIADGLSSLAIQSHALALTQAIAGRLKESNLNPGPVCFVQQGRVAVGDEVGALLQAESVILLVGERPGLSSPDSVGIYYTYKPRPGLNDASRNCISNVRPAGMDMIAASRKLLWLIQASRQLGLSGVQLKDRSDEGVLPVGSEPVGESSPAEPG